MAAPSAPYWGQLPSSKSGQTKARRPPDHLSSTPDRRPSLDGDQPPQRQNRISVQTTNTDAPTESTLSPFTSPTRSSFLPQGLAPRPPSLPYGADQYPPEFAENRRRRRSRNQENDYDYDYADADAAPPPAAPEVPKAPPVSYKHPYGTGGPPYPYPVAGGPPRSTRGRPDGPVSPSTMDAKYSQVPAVDRQGDVHVPGQSGDAVNGRRASTSSTDPARQPRRFPLGQQQPGRRKFADERSPLQRLELTLGSITKEEKRARVEAAEQAARERATQERAGPKADRSPEQDKQVRFSDRVPNLPAEEQRPRATSTTAAAQVSPATQKGRPVQNPPGEGNRYNVKAGRPHQNEVPVSRIPVPVPVPSKAQAAGIPQRNLSFRERAAKNDVKLPSGLESDSPAVSSPKTPANGVPLSRSGSNKLQKSPPRDPWLNQKMAAEKYITGARGTTGAAAGAGAQSSSGVASRTRGPDPTESASPPENRTPPSEREVGPSAAVARLSKAPSQSKADRLLGRTPSQSTPTTPTTPDQGHGLGTAALAVGAAGATAGAGAAAAGAHHQARREARSDSDSDDDHRRHLSDRVYRGREDLKPGQGIYQPPTYLDEWQHATIGTLSGALLDLNEELPPSVEKVEKDKTWWERRPSASSTRRPSMSSRPRTAEAFAGEYDDTNGMRF